MNSDVFDYVINSINNTLNNGIEYYKDNEDLKKRLEDIYEFINNEDDEYVEVEVVPTDDDTKNNKNKESAQEIKGLIRSFLDKQSNIGASALNLESNLKKDNKLHNYDKGDSSIYIEKLREKKANMSPEELEKTAQRRQELEKKIKIITTEPESKSMDDIPQSLIRESDDNTTNDIVKELVSDEKDYEQYHKDTNNDIEFDTTFNFDDIVTESKEEPESKEDVEPIEDDELIIEKPRKRSIFDIFKKN
jgi:hypothetical protein